MAKGKLDFGHPGAGEWLVLGGVAVGGFLLVSFLSRRGRQGPGISGATAGGLGSAGFGGLGSAGSPGTSGDGLGGITSTGAAGLIPGAVTGQRSTAARPARQSRRSAGGAASEVTRQVSQAVSNVLNAGISIPSSPGPSVGPSGPVNAPTSSPVSFKAIYQALRAQGLTAVQSAGILGNIQNESGAGFGSANPEAVGDAGTSFGLVQWHNTSYPGAAGYVTGNVGQDFKRQISAIGAAARKIGLTSGDPGAAGAQWASQFEGCVGCQPGGFQNIQRSGNALAIYGQAIREGWNNVSKPQSIKIPKLRKNLPFATPTGAQANARAGVAAASSSQIRSMFPVVQPVALRRPVSRPRRGRGATGFTGLAAAIRRAAAVIARRPPPRSRPRPVFRPAAGGGRAFL